MQVRRLQRLKLELPRLERPHLNELLWGRPPNERPRSKTVVQDMPVSLEVYLGVLAAHRSKWHTPNLDYTVLSVLEAQVQPVQAPTGRHTDKEVHRALGMAITGLGIEGACFSE